ncbi:MAG TPA: M67 family metallopeptidase [Puia sp.]|jgi:proteasome lid subunit RPN8/RPN11|nr:M67 family metallopeptidase [Puia sp.]
MIIIEPRVRQLLIEDALNTFPDECCGFMFGREEHDGTRLVVDILVVDNSKEGDKTRRFEISPQDYMEAERHALLHDWTLLGVYHSHPKHPAIPSEHDRKAAQPYFSYVIISVIDEGEKKVTHLRSWLLSDESQFEEEQVLDYQYS